MTVMTVNVFTRLAVPCFDAEMASTRELDDNNAHIAES